ncbi:MAG TPA: SRPBCC domain-containing protein [Rhizomicrobium sp.]|jgi:uncharacterized protein YndB with AHSA1/START domain
MKPEDSVLKVRRSILIQAQPERVWQEFASKPRMDAWWGAVTDNPAAGTPNGQWLDEYEPRLGGAILMAVDWNGERVRYGGTIRIFEAARELTFDNDWIPNRGWAKPTFITLRLSAVLSGTEVELFHHGFERTGGDFASEHMGYEQGWGMTQLIALKEIVESSP